MCCKRLARIARSLEAKSLTIVGKTLVLNWSAGSQEPIFNKTVKAGAAAEPNSRAEANTGRSFFTTISRGSCSAIFGSFRKKLSFSTLSFKLRTSMNWMVSTNLFWKNSLLSIRFEGFNLREGVELKSLW
uniref:Uncharacterized protein n=1 Tax=Arundo donax TaxID=35708 RepID=A0A0A9DTD6_ARUDO